MFPNVTDTPGRWIREQKRTVQDLQLELIARTMHNNFDGARVHRDLVENRELWQAVIFDRDGNDSLIKLRDLHRNIWNVDTLFVLARDPYKAQVLAEFSVRWLADTVEVASESATGWAVGDSGETDLRLVTFWWD